MPTRSALPLDAAETAAPDLLAQADLTLPDGATDVTVELVVHEHLKDASVTAFVAPRDDAEAMCVDAGSRPSQQRSLIYYEEEMLGEVRPAPGSSICGPSTGERNAKVIISPDDPARVTVLVYRVPTR